MITGQRPQPADTSITNNDNIMLVLAKPP